MHPFFQDWKKKYIDLIDRYVNRKCVGESESCVNGTRRGPIESDFEPAELCTNNCMVTKNTPLISDPDVNFKVKNCKL